MKATLFSLLVLFAILISTCISGEDIRVGRFEMISSPADPANEDYLKAMGFTEEIRSFFSKVSLGFEISKEGNKWTLKRSAGPNSKTFVFQSGEEIEEIQADGRKCKSIYQVGEIVATRILTCPDVSSNGTMEFTKEGMTLKRMAKNQILTQVFKRL